MLSLKLLSILISSLQTLINLLFCFQLFNLYREVVYTISHKLGGTTQAQLSHQLQLQLQKKPNAISAALAPLWQTVATDEKKQMSKEDLLKFAKEAFGIDDEKHSKTIEQIQDEKVKADL